MTATSNDELPRLGRYQVLNKLAQGGMAEIFLAKALGVMGFERLVAIKLIHSQLTRDGEFVKMFIDEARIAMHLSHRNIVQVFDLDKAGDTYFIAMEYVHGVNLYDVYERIASKGRWLDLPLALYIVAEVCKGLHFAHTRLGPDGRPLSIVHRDISPQNVLLSFEGEVKITDFGIAKAAERLHQTTPGIVKGKYAYMAPEILKERPVDGRADVFAAGVLLYELLVGENPYAGATPVATIENVLNKKVPPPSARGAMVSRELDDIAMQALSKDPDTRYRTAAELAEALTEHGLNLTTARRDIASGDSTVATLLAELFPEKLKRNTTAQPGGLKLPMVVPEPSRDTFPEVPASPATSDYQTTDPNQSESLDSTLMNLGPAPAIGGGSRRELYSADDEPSTALDLDPSSLYANDRTEGMQAVTAKPKQPKVDVEAATAKALPALVDDDTRPPVVVDDGLDRTMAHGANRAPARPAPSPSMLGPQPRIQHGPLVVPVHVPLTVEPPASRSEQLVVPVASKSQLGQPAFSPAPSGHGQASPAPQPNYGGPSAFGAPPHGFGGPGPGPAYPHGPPGPALGPGILAPAPPSPMPFAPSKAAEAPKTSRTWLFAGLALALAALGVVAALAVSQSSGGGVVAVPIITRPSGAEVSIDGVKQASTTPIEAKLPIGRSHRIELRLRNHKVYTQDLQPLEGLTPSIDVALQPVQGTIRFVVQPPDARVVVNGAPRGTVAQPVTGLEPGQDLVVRIEADGYKPHQAVVSLSEAAPEATITHNLEKAN
jgi:serine/threonine protein kinase